MKQLALLLLCFPSISFATDTQIGCQEILSSDTIWYQYSFNPTNASVTRVNTVHKCYPVEE